MISVIHEHLKEHKKQYIDIESTENVRISPSLRSLLNDVLVEELDGEKDANAVVQEIAMSVMKLVYGAQQQTNNSSENSSSNSSTQNTTANENTPPTNASSASSPTSDSSPLPDLPEPILLLSSIFPSIPLAVICNLYDHCEQDIEACGDMLSTYKADHDLGDENEQTSPSSRSASSNKQRGKSSSSSSSSSSASNNSRMLHQDLSEFPDLFTTLQLEAEQMYKQQHQQQKQKQQHTSHKHKQRVEMDEQKQQQHSIHIGNNGKIYYYDQPESLDASISPTSSSSTSSSSQSSSTHAHRDPYYDTPEYQAIKKKLIDKYTYEEGRYDDQRTLLM